MSQFKISEEWMLPLRSLNVALEIRLVGRSMGGTIRQVAEIILPRSSGRPPPLLPSLDINGRGSSARLVVFFDVKHQTEPEGTPKTGEKRSTPSGASAPSPARKRPRTAARPSPPLPPIGKGKGVSAVPSSSPTVDVLDPSAITSESPASAVAALLRKRMFSGATEASDPRLLALTGHLASSTKEQVSFRSRSREELGSTIREMLLMVTGLFMEVDARDHSLRESVDRQIEEARRDENLTATSDARGHLAAAREQIQTLQVELHSAREATKKAEDKAAEAAEHSKSLESELSRTCGILQETDKRAAEVEARCVEAASSKKVSRPPVKASSRSSKPSSRSSKSVRPSNRDGSSSTSTPAEGSRETSLAIVEQAQATGQVGQDVAHSAEEVLGGKTEPEGTPKTGEKRSTPSGASAPSPARKRPRTAARPSPPLPPIGKGKGVSAVPSSSPTVDVLDPSAITSESPASAVAALLRKRMFSGATEASDPRLLALTGHLASSTKEQVSFRSRSREELGSTIREMLLMVTGLFMEVDARDHSLRESVDRQIEEARRDENLTATSDARGHLAAAREQIQTLQVELHSAREATKKAEDKAAEAAEHSKSLESELSPALQERDDAIGQKAEVQRQYEALKADFERLQAYLDEVKAQKGGALARVEVLEQELGASSLRKREVDSDGESVLYGEDDFPMPRGDSRRNRDRPAESCSEESELGSEEDDSDSVKESLHPGSDVAPVINVASSGPRDTELPSEGAVIRDNVGEGVLTGVSPLRAIYPPTLPEG
ncbi:flocculation protein FLO11-like [Manihot esculenta]|uniref:flocculation protein FLO11-like n=1 Tax=Manihot esculenta TaxID=3983 RepID=UPI001CC61221|nr:flocculation protein FLO11-like [Manihot esculenta]